MRRPPLAPLLRDYEDDDEDDDLGLDPTTIEDPGDPTPASSSLPRITARHTVDRTIVGYRRTRLPEPVPAPGSRYCLKHPVRLDDPISVVIRWDESDVRSDAPTGEPASGRLVAARPPNTRRDPGVTSR